MAFVITDNCDGCRFTDCVTVCPVNCFYGDEKRLYIHPEECIDCGACEPECPVKAIYDESNLPAGKQEWVQINAQKVNGLPNITEKTDPLATAYQRKKELGFDS
ncbi:MAG: 4Fe-4S binding protein [Myxococcota bacterium]